MEQTSDSNMLKTRRDTSPMREALERQEKAVASLSGTLGTLQTALIPVTNDLRVAPGGISEGETEKVSSDYVRQINENTRQIQLMESALQAQLRNLEV